MPHEWLRYQYGYSILVDVFRHHAINAGVNRMRDEVRLTNCPACGAKGKVVRAETLRALVAVEFQQRISEGRYRFCATQGCPVAYFAEDGSHVFHRAELTVRVGVKETDGPRPICYCFGHTIEEMEEQIRRTGHTTVPDEVRTRLETEGCQCEVTNPAGSCCLGAVLAAADEAAKRLGG